MNEFRVTHPDELPRSVDRLVEYVAFELRDNARDNTPHGRTGDLSGGWNVERNAESQYRVANHVEYGVFVEYGTKFQRPQAMLGRAVASARSRYGR